MVRLAGYSAGPRQTTMPRVSPPHSAGMRGLAAGDPSAVLRIGAAITGLTAAALGYSAGRVSLSGDSRGLTVGEPDLERAR